MVTLINEIQSILNCSAIYAQKIVEYAEGDKDKLNYQIERQLAKQENNQAILEVKPHKANKGSKLRQEQKYDCYITKHNYA